MSISSSWSLLSHLELERLVRKASAKEGVGMRWAWPSVAECYIDLFVSWLFTLCSLILFFGLYVHRNLNCISKLRWYLYSWNGVKLHTHELNNAVKLKSQNQLKIIYSVLKELSALFQCYTKQINQLVSFRHTIAKVIHATTLSNRKFIHSKLYSRTKNK